MKTDRFPNDFMFQLAPEEYKSLRCQVGTLKKGQHSKYLPYAFTEQGVAMLSSVLNSKHAIEVNISYYVAAGKIDKDLLKEIISAVIEDDMDREGLKLKILMAISN